MIKSLVVVTIFGVVSCGRLDNLYLPPSGASAAARSSSGSFSSGGARPRIPIVRFDQKNEGDGSYRYAYESGNGINAQEEGSAQGDGTRAHGSYSYTAPDGQKITITYTADENGFVPQGSHIPTPPPIPAEIQRALDQNLADEARGVVDDGSYKPDDEGQYNPGRYDNGQGGFGAGFGAGAGAGGSNGGYRY